MSKQHAHEAWRSADTIKRLSDRVVGIGPFGIGLDGLVSWIPGANTVYSVAAGGFLLLNAIKAKAGAGTVTRMLGYLIADSASSTVPVVGWTVDLLFPGHLMAAKALQKDIEARHGLPEGVGKKAKVRKPRGRRLAVR